jgi:carboxyl-terminal processing protease
VVPDVIIPDLYDGIPQGEQEMDFHLPYDRIDPAKYTPCEAAINGGFAASIANASKRIAESEHFSNVKAKATTLAATRNSYTWSLNLNKYTQQQKNRKEEEKRYNDSAFKPLEKTVVPLKADLEAVNGDNAREAQRKDWMKPYNKDAWLDESVRMMYDLIKK